MDEIAGNGNRKTKLARIEPKTLASEPSELPSFQVDFLIMNDLPHAYNPNSIFLK